MFSPLSHLTKNFIPSGERPSIVSLNSTSSLLKSILITDDVQCDADFLVNHFLHSFVKAESPAIFVHAAQTLSHYHLVASKCGVNLQSFVDKKTVVAIDGMKLFADSLTPSSSSSSDGGGGSGANAERPLTRLLYDAIVEAVEVLVPRNCAADPSSRPLILLDDVSLLSSLGVSPRHVAAFVYSLRSRLASLPVTLILRLRDDVEEEIDEDDEEEEVHLVKLFAGQFDAHFRVRGLSTGFCRDVHGAIDYFEKIYVAEDGVGASSSYFGQGRMSYFTKMEKQFKIGEKTVAVFAPGLSAAVL